MTDALRLEGFFPLRSIAKEALPFSAEHKLKALCEKLNVDFQNLAHTTRIDTITLLNEPSTREDLAVALVPSLKSNWPITPNGKNQSVKSALETRNLPSTCTALLGDLCGPLTSDIVTTFTSQIKPARESKDGFLLRFARNVVAEWSKQLSWIVEGVEITSKGKGKRDLVAMRLKEAALLLHLKDYFNLLKKNPGNIAKALQETVQELASLPQSDSEMPPFSHFFGNVGVKIDETNFSQVLFSPDVIRSIEVKLQDKSGKTSSEVARVLASVVSEEVSQPHPGTAQDLQLLLIQKVSEVSLDLKKRTSEIKNRDIALGILVMAVMFLVSSTAAIAYYEDNNRPPIYQVVENNSSEGEMTNTLTPEAPLTPQTYEVVSGDTLFSISRRFFVDPDTLAKLNNLSNPNRIYVGQTLSIPSNSSYNGTKALPFVTPLPNN
jgi:LysM repeat protein